MLPKRSAARATPSFVLRIASSFALCAALMAQAVAAPAPEGEGIAAHTLEHRLVKLSYAGAETALQAFRMLGFTTIDPGPDRSKVPPANAGYGVGGMPGAGLYPGAGLMPGIGMPADASGAPQEQRHLQDSYAPSQLPVIVRLPGPDASQSGLVGAEAAVTRGDLGVSMIPSAATPLASDTVASESSQLLVLYQPSKPEQLRRVLKLLEQAIDVPARQILVEGMVLEVSHDGLDQLGVQWFEQRGQSQLTLGSVAVGSSNTLSFLKDTATAARDQFIGRIQALVQSGKAEVLSRPSVLTLDNRQATIRVGTDIPIATSKDASSATESRVSFSFQYLPTGILLNVRPRANRDGQEVSMLIDTTVSATVTGRDLEVRSAQGTVLASAPTIATRRVQTYARITNNTPLIIGGLVSRDTVNSHDRVPLLGDVPVLGKLFGSEKNVNNKREVIIVLTPTVMGEQFSANRVQPKDDEAFDSRGNELFRDSYRIKAEDVIDSRYIRANQHLANYRQRVNRAAAENAAFAQSSVARRFAGNAVPGEDILISGMMYQLLERLNVGGAIPLDRIQFFSKGQDDEFEIHTLAQELGTTKMSEVNAAFARRPGHALALSFTSQRNGGADISALAEPRATVQWITCADQTEWTKLLWGLNQPQADGRERYSILLRDADDVHRLMQVIAVKRLISSNGGESQATLVNYAVGRVIAIPEIKANQNHLLEAAVARHFFHSRHAFPAFDAEQARVFVQADELLKERAPGRGTE
jgi:general secretion pathway protein D